MVKKRLVAIPGISEEEWSVIGELADGLTMTIGELFITTIRNARKEQLEIAKQALEARKKLQGLKETV